MIRAAQFAALSCVGDLVTALPLIGRERRNAGRHNSSGSAGGSTNLGATAFVVHVPDVDATYARAVELGATADSITDPSVDVTAPNGGSDGSDATGLTFAAKTPSKRSGTT